MGTLTASLAEKTNTGGTPAWVSAVLALAGSALVANLLGGIAARLRASAETRRERYARATRTLVARVEYPYRIRRRTSDDPRTLSALADRGHDLQEQLAEDKAWVIAESRALGELFGRVVGALDEHVAPACREAWDYERVVAASGMNVRSFGPRDCQQYIDTFTCALRYRFGWRRALPNRVVSSRLREQCDWKPVREVGRGQPT